MAALHRHMDKVKEKAIKEYQVSQPYINEMRGYYAEGFEDFLKQAVLMFPDLGFSQIQINLIAPMTLVAKPILDNVETNDEVLVT